VFSWGGWHPLARVGGFIWFLGYSVGGGLSQEGVWLLLEGETFFSGFKVHWCWLPRKWSGNSPAGKDTAVLAGGRGKGKKTATRLGGPVK